MPGYTTNVEFGYWLAKNNEKVLYGKPESSIKNEYLDWLYLTETDKCPITNLKELLKFAVNLANKKKEENIKKLTK